MTCSSKKLTVNDLNNVYFAGIGGVSMSSLALILRSLGKNVAGYDFKVSETTQHLENKGIRVDYDSACVNLSGFETLCYTAAMREDDPVLVLARNSGLRFITRAELLGMITGTYAHSIGIAGTHGKSTTTGFVTQILLEADSDSTILSGAHLPSIGSTYRVGNGDIAAFEACEYKNSYHAMRPTVRVVLNVELDHVDFFGSLENIIDSFRTYINNKSENGENIAIVNLDNENAVKAAENATAEVLYFSACKKTDYYAENIDLSTGFASFDLMYRGVLLTRVSLSVPGMHNVYDALAAAASAHVCGIGASAIKVGLENFVGAKRRFEKVGVLSNGAVVVDDYAHHPDEIRATLSAAKKVATGKVICIFQPHTYSRTKALLPNFASALSMSDKVLCAKIYAAREKNEYGISETALSESISDAEYYEDFSAIASRAEEISEKGDIIITMGAGDIYKVSDYFLFG